MTASAKHFFRRSSLLTRLLIGLTVPAVFVCQASVAKEVPSKNKPGMADIVKASSAADWRSLVPENTLYLELEKGRVVIFAAGVGAPFFTTDSGAALRAAEMGCDALLKGTSVDGVYTADPKKDASATRYETLTYHDVLAKDLKVMDASAIALMRDSGIPIVVFSIREDNSLRRTLTGEGTFTVISSNKAA